MNKKTISAGLLLLVLGLSGCMYTLGPDGDNDVDVIGELVVRLISHGRLYAPTINNMPFGYQSVVPLSTLRLDFSGIPDQYGNPTGLSDTERWKMVDVHIQLSHKGPEDTVFWPSLKFPVPYVDLDCVWFPGWTAPLETVSGLPIPFAPLDGYPWSPCRTIDIGIDPMPSQTATITATAKADVLSVEFIAPEHAAGSYQLDVVGSTPTASNSIRYHVSEPGVYTVIWRNGDEEKIYEVNVPADWFWVSESWTINVEPTTAGSCGIM